MGPSKAQVEPPLEGADSCDVAAHAAAAPEEDTRTPVWAPVEPFDRAAAFRTACRLFRGFELLPQAVVVSVHGFPHLFVARRGALTLREREIIARAITGEPPGSFGGDPHSMRDEARRGSRSLEAAPELSGREQELADFAWKVTQRWAQFAIEDLDRLLASGYGARAVREAADVALAFRVIHRLTRAVAAHVPVVPIGTREHARHGRPDARGRSRGVDAGDEDDEAFVVLPTAPSIRDGGACKASRAGFDSRGSR